MCIRDSAKGLPDTDTKGNKVNFDAQLVELQIKQSELNIQSLEKETSETTVYAPIDGVVTYLTDANVGDNIPMRNVVCKVADVSSPVSYTHLNAIPCLILCFVFRCMVSLLLKRRNFI